jgi:hypothetical protein
MGAFSGLTICNLSCQGEPRKIRFMKLTSCFFAVLGSRRWGYRGGAGIGPGTVLPVLLAVCVLAPWSLLSQSAALPQDKGPATIVVSAYPAPQQAAYKLFSSKCSRCHTLARAINTTMTSDEWERSVKRMMHMANSGISDSQAKQTFDFLVFDQVERKDKNPQAFFPASDAQKLAQAR